MRWYVGIQAGLSREKFEADEEPTRETHGARYLAVIGPFDTERGAAFCERYGAMNNPHIQCVQDAEELAAYYANKGEESDEVHI